MANRKQEIGVFIIKKKIPPPPDKKHTKKQPKNESKQTVLIIEVRYRMLIL